MRVLSLSNRACGLGDPRIDSADIADLADLFVPLGNFSYISPLACRYRCRSRARNYATAVENVSDAESIAVSVRREYQRLRVKAFMTRTQKCDSTRSRREEDSLSGTCHAFLLLLLAQARTIFLSKERRQDNIGLGRIWIAAFTVSGTCSPVG